MRSSSLQWALLHLCYVELLNPTCMQVATRTLLIASEQDWMIPSADEPKALEALLPNVQVPFC